MLLSQWPDGTQKCHWNTVQRRKIGMHCTGYAGGEGAGGNRGMAPSESVPALNLGETAAGRADTKHAARDEAI